MLRGALTFILLLTALAAVAIGTGIWAWVIALACLVLAFVIGRPLFRNRFG